MLKTLFLLVLSVCLAIAASAGDFPNKLVIAYEDKTQFPYYLGDDGRVPVELPGAAVELVQMLEQEIPGLEIELQRYPWKRCLAMLEAGKVDAIFNASYTEERASFARYPQLVDGSVDNSRRITNISYSWYKNTQRADSNVSNPLVAAPLGYSIVSQLETAGYRVVQAPTSLSALRMLSANYIELAALQTVTGDHLLATHQEELKSIEKMQPAIDDKAYFLLFSQAFYDRYPEVTDQVWRSLAHLRDTQLPTIVQRYLAGTSE